MDADPHTRVGTPLTALAILYATASFLHFAHNATYLNEYPNLPDWITPAGVYATWLGITALGAAGFALFRFGRPYPGLLLLAVYAALGFDGLQHYTRAPYADHTAIMNFTIGFEVAAAAALFTFVVNTAAKRMLGDLLDR